MVSHLCIQQRKDVNFSISEITFKGDKIINNYLKTNLSKYKNGIYDKNFSIHLPHITKKHFLKIKRQILLIMSYQLKQFLYIRK